MSRLEKLKAKFLKEPSSKDITWAELKRLLRSYGYKEHQGRGSRVKFINDKSLDNTYISLHKRHPNSNLLPYQVDIARKIIKEND